MSPFSRPAEYITTAIVYPNASIHLGFAWETIATDFLARAKRGLGAPTRFVTGMDEHSVNVAKAAEAKGLTPKAFCDEMSVSIQKILGDLDVRFDRFIRTSDADHHRVVQALVEKAFAKGDIYQAKYEGHYCEGCEAFYLDKDLIDGKCPHHKSTPKWISEENYFFKLSKYENQIKELFKTQPDFLQPENRRNEVLHFIESGLKDFSISRSTSTWGIPLPFDQKHIVYVWFDALVNYVTAAKYLEGEAEFKKYWPANLHVIGKDITRFHCIYWPAMLMSVELPLPKRVFAHGFLNLKGDRMSKTTGNIVRPEDVLKLASSDALRYYLLAENQFGQDGNFTWEALMLKSNADLSNDMGNLVNRSINMTKKYFPGEELQAPVSVTHSRDVIDSFAALPKELQAAVDAVDTVAYATACQARSRLLNLYIDRTKPWGLAKTNTPESIAELREVLFALLEGIRQLAAALSPILTKGAAEIFHQLGQPYPEEIGRISNLKWGSVAFNVGEPKPVFPRIELPEELKG